MSDSIKFIDNLVFPKEKEVIKFRGPEPFRLYGAARNIFLDVFELAGKDIFEEKLKWDSTGEDKTYWVKWHFEKKMDSWSKLFISITYQGAQNSRTRLGDVSLSLKPTFETKVDVGFLQKPFWWIYYYLFYKKRRVIEFYRAKTIFNQFKLRIGQLYGMQIEESY